MLGHLPDVVTLVACADSLTTSHLERACLKHEIVKILCTGCGKQFFFLICIVLEILKALMALKLR